MWSWPENWPKALFHYYYLIKLCYYRWDLIDFFCNIFWHNNIISLILIYKNCVIMDREMADSFIPLLLFDEPSIFICFELKKTTISKRYWHDLLLICRCYLFDLENYPKKFCVVVYGFNACAIVINYFLRDTWSQFINADRFTFV